MIKNLSKILLPFALSVVSLLSPSATQATPNQNNYFINTNQLHWSKSPQGYEVSSGELLVLRPDGKAALIFCSFYRDHPTQTSLSYGDVGGFSLQTGRWSKIDANPCIITLNLHLIDADKLSRSAVARLQSEHSPRKFSQLKTGSIDDTKIIKDDHGSEFTRIAALKNQSELNEKIEPILSKSD